MKATRVATICIRTSNNGFVAARDGFIKAWKSGKYQGEQFGFESPAALFRTISPKRWELLGRLQQIGPVGIRELARELERDFRRVHDDVIALLETGLLEKTADGKIWVPFKEIRTDIVLKPVAA